MAEWRDKCFYQLSNGLKENKISTLRSESEIFWTKNSISRTRAFIFHAKLHRVKNITSKLTFSLKLNHRTPSGVKQVSTYLLCSPKNKRTRHIGLDWRPKITSLSSSFATGINGLTKMRSKSKARKGLEALIQTTCKVKNDIYLRLQRFWWRKWEAKHWWFKYWQTNWIRSYRFYGLTIWSLILMFVFCIF